MYVCMYMYVGEQGDPAGYGAAAEQGALALSAQAGALDVLATLLLQGQVALHLPPPPPSLLSPFSDHLSTCLQDSKASDLKRIWIFTNDDEPNAGRAAEQAATVTVARDCAQAHSHTYTLDAVL